MNDADVSAADSPRRSHFGLFSKLTLILGLLLLGGAIAARVGFEWGLIDPPMPRPGTAGGGGVGQVQHQKHNGFDLSQSEIPPDEIHSGGPPKDGIPALDDPHTIPAGQAAHLAQSDRVIGIHIGDQARAYPLSILDYHELVNDNVGGQPILVSYCPLCDSAVVFDRRTSRGELTFGVSGLLYNSNVLMYDRGASESLWSQMKGQAISGPAVGERLRVLPMELTTWQSWHARHPETDVLSTRTGHQRDYRRSPYDNYFSQPALMFPVQPLSPRLPAKEPVLGIWDDQRAVAMTWSTLGDDQPRRLQRQLGDKRFTVQADPESRTLRVVEADQGLSWMNSLWFAWYAFRPHTEIDGK